MGYNKREEYVIPVGFGTTPLNPVDATTYFFGHSSKAGASTNEGYAKLYFPFRGIIRSAYLWWNGIAPTNEDISMYIRKNSTTDTLVETIGDTDAAKLFNNQNLNIAMDAGDYLEIKFVCPTWVTNPTSVVIYGMLGVIQ